MRRALVAAGVEIRPAARRPVLAGRTDEVAALRREGWSYKRNGDRLGVSASAVHTFARARRPG